jgi:hypothetical protein
MIWLGFIVYMIVWAAAMLLVSILFPRKKKRGHH